MAHGETRNNDRAPVRLVQGSHIMVPYEQNFTLIGTTDQDYQGDAALVHASESGLRAILATHEDIA